MNVLWITNIVLPEAQTLLLGRGGLKSTGGWLVGAATKMSELQHVKLFIASLSRDVKELTQLKGDKIEYFLLPFGKGNMNVNHEYESYWQKVNNIVKPDVVHIHGTEYSHGLAWVDACGAKNVCVSIQGLTSVYSRYYYGSLSIIEIIKSTTLASILRGGILKGCRDFRRRGLYERELLRKVNHIIGRTSWDKAHAWAINPVAQYHYGGETLRPEFYVCETWKYKNCRAHSIFLSQGNYPIKGLHMVINAMQIVLRHYPDAQLRIAGRDIVSPKTTKDRLLFSDYGKIVKRAIKKLELENRVTFTGPLDGNGMVREYLNTNLFICPSSIENSPNSLGEAQILGVPVLASYVGGITDMMRGDEDNLYRFEEIEMLAYKIVKIFELGDKVNTQVMREKALIRHSQKKNADDLIEVYQDIMRISCK